MMISIIFLLFMCILDKAVPVPQLICFPQATIMKSQYFFPHTYYTMMQMAQLTHSPLYVLVDSMSWYRAAETLLGLHSVWLFSLYCICAFHANASPYLRHASANKLAQRPIGSRDPTLRPATYFRQLILSTKTMQTSKLLSDVSLAYIKKKVWFSLWDELFIGIH